MSGQKGPVTSHEARLRSGVQMFLFSETPYYVKAIPLRFREFLTRLDVAFGQIFPAAAADARFLAQWFRTVWPVFKRCPDCIFGRNRRDADAPSSCGSRHSVCCRLAPFRCSHPRRDFPSTDFRSPICWCFPSFHGKSLSPFLPESELLPPVGFPAPGRPSATGPSVRLRAGLRGGQKACSCSLSAADLPKTQWGRAQLLRRLGTAQSWKRLGDSADDTTGDEGGDKNRSFSPSVPQITKPRRVHPVTALLSLFPRYLICPPQAHHPFSLS